MIRNGNASRKRLGELVAGKEVRVEFDKYDRYVRIVGKVWVTPPDCPTCGKTLDAGLAQITSGMAHLDLRHDGDCRGRL